MPEFIRVGLIGLGAIGQSLIELSEQGALGSVEVAAVLVRDIAAARVRFPSPRFRLHDSIGAFLDEDTQLVVEAAGQEALRAYGAKVIEAGKDLMPVSTGAFADSAFLEEMRSHALRHGRRILIPSGSIGGLDAISAAAVGDITEVAHTIRKPLRAFAPEQLAGLGSGAHVLFDGFVADGARSFPENANAATAVGLAGISPGATRLRIVADPSVERNVQEVDVTGQFGKLRFTIENVPSANPKTSRLVAFSVAKALRNLTASIVIGL
jgi:aspartate dehydrogenase